MRGPGTGSAGPAPRRMVFHTPFPVSAGANTASAIRPWKMLQAFKALGFEVFQITGYAAERRRRFASLRRGVAAGWKPDFVYSEAATIPSSFTEPRHFPLILNLDRKIFRFLHEHGTPIGVFYRDVYWAFDDYVQGVGVPTATVMKLLYSREIKTFNRYADVVFLPSVEMGRYVPGLNGPLQVALPPGADPQTGSGQSHDTDGSLRLFYVGAVGGEHYDVSALIEGVERSRDVELTICTREENRRAAEAEYAETLGEATSFVMGSGDALDPLYDQADIALLFMRPQEYRSFAAPVKLYEYLGRGKPIIASRDTAAAKVVEEADAGWVADFDAASLADLLKRLKAAPAEVAAKAANAAKAGQSNTWEARAAYAAGVLKEVGA